MYRIDPENYGTPDAVHAADTPTLLAAHIEAHRVWSTCGGHKLADRMRNVMDLTRAELTGRGVRPPTGGE